jgi:predicted nucleic acid-binding protein
LKYLLDTCTISEFTKVSSNKNVLDFIQQKPETSMFISSMTIAELHRGINRLEDGAKKSNLLSWLGDIEQQFDGKILAFDHDCAIEWGRLCSNLEKQGRKLAALDSIIAAIASKNNMVLVTRNVKDFEGTDLEIINPWGE